MELYGAVGIIVVVTLIVLVFWGHMEDSGDSDAGT